MRRLGWSTLRAALIGCLLVAVGWALSRDVPWKSETTYRCPYCGARATRSTLVLIPMPLRVTEGSLSEYWRKSVDPRHRHTWVATSSVYNFASGLRWSQGHVEGHRPRWVLGDLQLVAILSGLPTPQKRSAFVEWLWVEGAGENAPQVSHTAFSLRTAYREKPTRTDWPEVLRKLGCYPGTGAKSP